MSEVEAKIIKWLKEEKFSPTSKESPDAYFHIEAKVGCIYCERAMKLEKWQARQTMIDQWFLKPENDGCWMKECPLIKDYEFLDGNDAVNSAKFKCTWVETGETAILMVVQMKQGIPHYKVISVCDEEE